MHPDLIAGLPIKTYGFCMALGFLAAWQVLSWLCRRTGRLAEPLSNLLMMVLFGGIVGARLEYVREFWGREFAADPLSMFKLWQGGLVFYGGLILAIAVFLVWCRVRRERVAPVADLFVTVIPLAHAFGRVGCFFYGCCYGRLSGSSLAVAFPRHSPAWNAQLAAGMIDPSAPAALPVLPTQLFEAAGCLVIFAIVLAVYLKSNRPASDGSPAEKKAAGLSAAVYLASYGVLRFLLEMLRGDPRAAVLGLSIGQTISLGVFLAGLVFAIAASRRRQ